MEPIQNIQENNINLSDGEVIKNLNKEFFNELQRRRVILKGIYPNLDNAPKSIKDEYYNASWLVEYLKKGIASSINGPILTEDNHVVDAFHLKKYIEALNKYNSLKEQNANLISKEDDAKVYFHKIDVQLFINRINSATTAQQISYITEELEKFSEFQELDTILKFKEIYKLAKEKLNILSQQEEKIEIENQEKVEMKNQAFEIAKEKYAKTNGLVRFYHKITNQRDTVIENIAKEEYEQIIQGSGRAQ